jgi:hypothetical protein
MGRTRLLILLLILLLIRLTLLKQVRSIRAQRICDFAEGTPRRAPRI